MIIIIQHERPGHRGAHIRDHPDHGGDHPRDREHCPGEPEHRRVAQQLIGSERNLLDRSVDQLKVIFERQEDREFSSSKVGFCLVSLLLQTER